MHPSPSSPAPLILTLAFNPDDQARFERLRQAHFPAGRNHIPAHLTLFHHLPGEELDGVRADLATACGHQAPCSVEVTGLRSLGRGVAYALASAELARLRSTLAQAWHERLTAQDRQRWQPHVTIQNKAQPAEAKALLAAMQAAFTPFQVRAEGLLLWRYRGGPWEPAGRFPFAQSV